MGIQLTALAGLIKGGEAGAEEGASGAAAAGPAAAPEMEEVVRTRRKTLRLPLSIGERGFALPRLAAEQLKVAAGLPQRMHPPTHAKNPHYKLLQPDHNSFMGVT